MNEVLSLFPVLLVVYVLQCIAAAPPDTVVFLLDHRMHGRLLRHFWPVSPSHRLFLLNPFFPRRSAVYVCGFPFSFLAGPTGEVCGVNFLTPSSAASFPTGLAFDPPRPVTSRSKQLLVTGSPVAVLRSECSAARLAIFLKKLQSAPPPKRNTVLDRELRRMFALDPLRQRLQLLVQCTVLLNSVCLSLFLFLFLVAPTAIYAFGLHRLWPGLLLTLVLFSFFILWAFRRARHRLYPKAKHEGIQDFLTIALSPFAAIRAIDHLVADLLEDFHPVAVAFAVLSEKDFLKFAERELRKTRFVTHDSFLEKSITTFLLAQKFDPQSLLRPPLGDDVHSRTYCPACLTQYVIQEGTCWDCGGVKLEQLPPPGGTPSVR